MKRTDNINHRTESCMRLAHVRFILAVKRFFLSVLFLAVALFEAKAGDIGFVEKEAPGIVYEEIPVNVRIEGFKNFYVDAIYSTGNVLYVNIKDLFDMLKIPCIVGQKGDSIGGFLENENHTYSIDYNNKQINVGSNTFNSPKALVKEMGSIYIESSQLANAFGITLNFNYRALTITLKSDFELPAIKQMRTEKIRQNLAKMQDIEIADTVLERNYHLFKFGTLDWSVASTQVWNGATSNQFGFGLGTELLYGEADISLNYYNQYKFDARRLQYIWRWVDNENKIIRQAQIGRLNNQTISFLSNQVIGAVIRNSPTTIRKATGFYSINEVTEPNWTVELYINNVLVDYTRADASGSFTFKIPVVYGYTTLKLKYYGPLGEERTEERTVNVPYTVMPAKEFEYSVSAGIVQDSSSSRFGKGEFNYGVNRLLTVGGGVEYLSSIPNGPFIPYAKATLQPFSKLTMNTEYAYGVRTSGMLNYYFNKDMLLEIDYTKYVDGQLATHFKADVEKKVKLSIPVRYKKIRGFAKLDFTQLDYKEFSYSQANTMLSVYYLQFSANSTTQINWIGQHSPYINTDISLSYRLKKGIVVRPSARYNVSEGSLMSCKAEIEKRFRFGYFTASYERNFSFDDHFINVGFKYDLPFARTSVSVSHSKNKYATTEYAQGSTAFGGDKYTYLSNNSSVSKGGILIYPFLDLNNNGIFDKGEHLVKLHSVKIEGGRVVFSLKDSIIRIPDLTAFTSYMLEFMDNDLDNIAWQFKNKLYQVLIDPNQFKRVDVPVIPLGEVSGMVYLDNDDTIKGLGRILISFYEKKSKREIAQTLSESDGYTYFLGLEPGDYIARVDSVQLSNLGYSATPMELSFKIKTIELGDMVSGLNFIIRTNNTDQQDYQNSVADNENELVPNDSIILPISSNPVKLMFEKKISEQDSVKINVSSLLHRIDQKLLSEKKPIDFIPGDTLYKVQLLALPKPLKDKNYFTKLIAAIPGLTIEETLGEDGLYHYSTQASSGISESRDLQRRIRKTGWKDSFIAKYAGERRTETAFRRKLDKLGRGPDKIVPVKQLPTSMQNNAVQETKKGEPLVEKSNVINNGYDLVTPYSALHQGDAFYIESDLSSNMPGDTIYAVQLLALSKPIRIDNYFAMLLSKIPGLKISETRGEDGIYRYSAKTFQSLEKARKFNAVIRQNGWVDSFITTYYVVEKRH